MDCNFTKKTVRIINFQPKNSLTSPLFKQSFFLKFQDKICLENILFVSKSLKNLSSSVFVTRLVFPPINIIMKTQVQHRVDLTKLSYKINRYGKYSITANTVEYAT